MHYCVYISAPCASMSCEHLCVSQANDTAKCLCKDDYKMDVNGSCVCKFCIGECGPYTV